jgi:hypothetical protein
MSIRLEQTVPFGRSLREYELMFSLSAADRRSRILDCAAGPSSFNAELTAAGGDVRSIDPLYQFGGAEIQRQFVSTLDHVIEQVRATPQNWVWRYHRDPEDLRRNRIAVMDTICRRLQRGDGTQDDISAAPCRTSRSKQTGSTSHCRRTFSFSTRTTSMQRFTSLPFEPCCASRGK